MIWFIHFLVQIYVDDIIFGSSNPSLYESFANLMKGEFEMSLMGELTFFLEHQIYQSTNRTFISQEKYTKELIRCLESAKPLVPQ